MPFGLVNAPPTFQRAMTVALRGCEDFAAVYIDDVLVYSRDPQQHLQHLRKVFECLKKQAYHVRLSKCEFMSKKVKFLGHLLSSEGIAPSDGREKDLDAFQPSFKTSKEVKAFLGIVMWYRCFIPHVATIASPLFPPNIYQEKVAWTPQATKAVESLKEIILAAPTLARFDRELPTRVTTDALAVGVGAVLEQFHLDPDASITLGQTPTEVTVCTTGSAPPNPKDGSMHPLPQLRRAAPPGEPSPIEIDAAPIGPPSPDGGALTQKGTPS